MVGRARRADGSVLPGRPAVTGRRQTDAPPVSRPVVRLDTLCGMSTPFTPDAVEAIKRHMNDDHGDDALLICKGLGGQPEATGAKTSGVDTEAIEFVAVVGGEDVTVRVPWSTTLTERAQVRGEVVRLYREACAALGLPARGEH